MAKKMSTLAVARKVDWEGLDYCIQNYMNGDSIEDPKLAALWDDAREILNEIQGILNEALESADESDEDEDLDDEESEDDIPY